VERGRWVWCQLCRRCYREEWDTGRWGVGESWGRPYFDCDNDAGYVVDWGRLREVHTEWPAVPMVGEVYELALAWRREKDGERRWTRQRGWSRDWEAMCPECLTINEVRRARCKYCDDVLPGPKLPGKDLRLGQRWGYASGGFVVFRG
jgi:hypothetical protein